MDSWTDVVGWFSQPHETKGVHSILTTFLTNLRNLQHHCLCAAVVKAVNLNPACGCDRCSSRCWASTSQLLSTLQKPLLIIPVKSHSHSLPHRLWSSKFSCLVLRVCVCACGECSLPLPVLLAHTAAFEG